MGKYLDLLRENDLQFNQSKNKECHLLLCKRTDETKIFHIPNPTHCQNCQNPTTQAWEQLEAPDLRQLPVEVERARREHWITPTASLMALWRAINAHFGANLTSQQIGAVKRLVDANPTANVEHLNRLVRALVNRKEIKNV